MRRSGPLSLRLRVGGLLAVLAVSLSLASSASAASPEFLSNLRPPTQGLTPVIAWGEMNLEVGGLAASENPIKCTYLLNGAVGNEAGHGVGEIQGFSSTCKPFNDCPLCEGGEAPEKEGELPGEKAVYVSPELPFEEELREGEVCSEEGKKTLNLCPGPEERTTVKYIKRLARRNSLPWKAQLISGVHAEEAANLFKLGATGSNCYPTEKAIVEGKEVERAARFETVPAGCVAVNVIMPGIGFEDVLYGSLEPVFVNGFGNGLNASRLEFTEAGKLQTSGATVGSEEGVFTGDLTLVGGERQLITAR